jgi:hypothetical protein
MTGHPRVTPGRAAGGLRPNQRADRKSIRLRRLALALAVSALAGCGSTSASDIDSTPTKLDGTESHEFEQDDIEAAAEASDGVKEYCAGAVSEAQRLGCESHVTEEDLP